ncbi:MoaD/ThiS family protein [Maricaulis sp.]|uniref:MoaD/ThiS family protein n=1 Tax=Maricaulis sp. TaxID=1486257 RepID=UPI0025C36F2C|nr:MoaD/ThiS family protein [Maricaulis sp.]
MHVHIRYMAALRDRLGEGETTLDLPPDVSDSETLIAHLTASDAAAAALAAPEIRLIRNDRIVTRPSALEDGDRLAFCPPFTGG